MRESGRSRRAAFHCGLRGAATHDARDPTHDRSWAAGFRARARRPIRAGDQSRRSSTGSVYQVLQDRRGFHGLQPWKDWSGTMGISTSGILACLDRQPLHGESVAGHAVRGPGGTLWVATDVLTRFDPNLGKFTAVLNPRSGPSRPAIDSITAIHDGPGGALWVGMSSYDQSGEVSEAVLYEVNPASGMSVPHWIDTSITDGRPVGIRAIEEDRRGRLWLGTSIGLIRFDPATKSSGTIPTRIPAHASCRRPSAGWSGTRPGTFGFACRPASNVLIPRRRFLIASLPPDFGT